MCEFQSNLGSISGTEHMLTIICFFCPETPHPHLREAGRRVVHGHRVMARVHEHRHQVAVLRVHVGAPQLPRTHLMTRQVSSETLAAEH